MFRKSVLPVALSAMFFTAPVAVQQTGARWLAFQGCWTAMAGAPADAAATTQLVCIVPGSNLSTARLATVESGRVVQSTELAVTGAPVPRSEGGCAGTERASWSAEGKRVYLRVEQTCDGGTKRSATGVMTVLTESEWLDVQSVTVAGQNSVRVVHYSEVTDLSGVPAEIVTPLRANAMASRAARIAASAPVATADVIEASKTVDAAVLEAWLVEAHQDIAIDGKELLRLQKAGVSSSVTDLLVALAYPNVFSVDHSGAPAVAPMQPAANPNAGVMYGSGGGMYGDYYDPFFYDPFYYDRYSRYGYNSSLYNSRYGYYGSRNRFYTNYSPVIVIVRDGSTVGEPIPAVPQGKVVSGQGYTRGGSTAGGSSSSVNKGTSSSGSSGSTTSGSGSSSTGSSGASTTTGTTTTRTAKPKTVPPP